jgi:hypothetical protein
MNKEIDREKAIANLREEAQRRVIKNEIMRFRLEAQTFERLLKFAKKINKPVGTLVREWVVEKLDQAESKNKQSPQIKAISIITTTLAERGVLKADQVVHINKLLMEQSDHLPY